MNLADIPQGTIFAVLTFRVGAYAAWNVQLYRQAETTHSRKDLGYSSAMTLWGARYEAHKLYRRYLKRKKIADGHTVTMIFGHD